VRCCQPIPASELVAKQIKDLVGADLAMLIEKAQDEGSYQFGKLK